MKIVCTVILSLIYALGYPQRIINVVQWGADPTGHSDAVPAIQKAIDAADPNTKSIIYFPKGKYLFASFTKTSNSLENYCVKMHKNLEFRGEGNNSILMLASHLYEGTDAEKNAHLFYGKQLQNVAFYKLRINLNGTDNAPGAGVKKNHAAIFISHGRNVTLEKINISNAAGTNMINIKGKGSLLKIQQCSFTNEMRLQQVNCHQYDFSFVYSEWDSTYIKNTVIFLEKDAKRVCENQRPYNGGIEIHGSASRVNNCSISNCFPGIYIASTGKAMKNVDVSNNVFKGCTKGISFWIEYPMDSITISKNNIGIMSEKMDHFRFCTGIEMPNGNANAYNATLANASSVKHLFIRNNVITANTTAENASGIILHSIHESRIENNSLFEMGKYGIALLGSKWSSSNSNISGNEIGLKMNNEKSKKQNKHIPVFISDNFYQDQIRICSFKNIKAYDNTTDFFKKMNRVKTAENKCFYQVEIPVGCKSMKNDCFEILKHKDDVIIDKECWDYLP